MRRKTVAVVDIRSADLTALIGERGVNHTFNLKGQATIPYLGYEKGVLLDEVAFKSQLKSLIKQATVRLDDEPYEFVVGIPSEFLSVREKTFHISYPAKKRLFYREVERVVDRLTEQDSSAYFTPLQRSALSYALSDGSTVSDPVHSVTTSLSGRMSYIYASNYFTDLVKRTLSPAEEYSIRFLPTPLCQGMFLLSEEERKKNTLFIDFDVYNSELLWMSGDAVLSVKSLSIGEATALDRLSRRYSTDDEEFLVRLLRTTNLFFLEPDGPRTRRMNVEREDVYFYDVNEIVYSVIDDLVEGIYDFLKALKSRLTSGVKRIVIAGRGLPDVKGFREYLSRYLQIPVIEAMPPLPYYNKAISLSAYSLMDMAIDISEKKYSNHLSFKFLE